MNAPRLTWNDIVGWSGKDSAPDKWPQLETRERIRALRQELRRHGIVDLWAGTRAEILKKCQELLDIELLDVLGRAWSKSAELLRYRDAERYPPEKTYYLTLIEHTVRSAHEPILEIRVNRQTIAELNLKIEVAIDIQGMKLTIKGGKVHKIATGHCVGKGSLSLEDVPLTEVESKELELPGTIELAEGLEI